jgi:hypothetical protein
MPLSSSHVVFYLTSFEGTPVVYVSFNYRLGPLGFPTGEEASAKNALNLGLRDQLAALQWIQDNIAVFNGDKSKVCSGSTTHSSTHVIYRSLYLQKAQDRLRLRYCSSTRTWRNSPELRWVGSLTSCCMTIEIPEDSGVWRRRTSESVPSLSAARRLG